MIAFLMLAIASAIMPHRAILARERKMEINAMHEAEEMMRRRSHGDGRDFVVLFV
jgi:hypothetical protein